MQIVFTILLLTLLLILLLLILLLLIMLLLRMEVVVSLSRWHILLRQPLQVNFKHRIRSRPPQPERDLRKGKFESHRGHLHGCNGRAVNAVDDVPSLKRGKQACTRVDFECITCKPPTLLCTTIDLSMQRPVTPVMCCCCFSAEAGDDGISRVMTATCRGSATPATNRCIVNFTADAGGPVMMLWHSCSGWFMTLVSLTLTMISPGNSLPLLFAGPDGVSDLATRVSGSKLRRRSVCCNTPDDDARLHGNRLPHTQQGARGARRVVVGVRTVSRCERSSC